MKTFLTKLAMLGLFILTVLCGWGALSMSFSASIFNILLGVMAIFFLFRALELVDKINNFGAYYPDDKEDNHPPRGPRQSPPEEDEEEQIPQEE